MKSLDLSIVIPARSDTKVLAGLLKTLLHQRGASFEVIVVSNPTPMKAIRRDPRVRYIHSAPEGVNRARNAGVRASRGEWIYFLDDDCRLVSRDHLEKLTRKLRSLGPETVLGGPYIHAGSGRWSEAYHLLQLRYLAEGMNSPVGAKHLLGGNLALHHKVFEKFLFNEDIEFGGAEVEFLYRLWRAGFRGEFAEDLPVRHEHELTAHEFVKKAVLQGFHVEELIGKYPDLIPFPRHYLPTERIRKFKTEIEVYGWVFDNGRAQRRLGLRPQVPKIIAPLLETSSKSAEMEQLCPADRQVKPYTVMDRIKEWWTHPSARQKSLGRFLLYVLELKNSK